MSSKNIMQYARDKNFIKWYLVGKNMIYFPQQPNGNKRGILISHLWETTELKYKLEKRIPLNSTGNKFIE